MGRASNSDKPRPILFKLRESELKNKIWLAKKKLKGTGITLSEFLTKSRHGAFMAARRKFGITKCWTHEGSVYVMGSNGVRHRVVSIVEVDKIDVPLVTKTAAAARKPAGTSKSRRAGNNTKKK